MIEQGVSVAALAPAIAKREGLSKLTTGAVYRWLADPSILSPSRLFGIEEVLNVPPGTFSRPLGYLPVGSVPSAPTIEDALRGLADLTDTDREIILAAIEAAARTRRARRQRRSPHRSNNAPQSL